MYFGTFSLWAYSYSYLDSNPSHFSLFVHLYQCCFQLNIYSTLSFKPPHKGVQHIRNAFIYYYWQQHTETFIALSASNSHIKGFSALEIHLSLTTTHRNTYSTFSFKLPHKGVHRIRNVFIYHYWQRHTHRHVQHSENLQKSWSFPKASRILEAPIRLPSAADKVAAKIPITTKGGHMLICCRNT